MVRKKKPDSEQVDDVKPAVPESEAFKAPPSPAEASKAGKAATPAPKDEKPEEPAVAPPEPASKHDDPTPYYEVQRDVTISWGQSMIRLRAGQVVSDKRFGPGGIDKLVRAGVALKRVAAG